MFAAIFGGGRDRDRNPIGELVLIFLAPVAAMITCLCTSGPTRMSNLHMTKDVGTLCWMSPEALKCRCFSRAADVWAFGVLLWELLTQRRLFFRVSDYETVKQVQAAKVPPIDKLHKDADATLQSIISTHLKANFPKIYSNEHSNAISFAKVFLLFLIK